MAMEENRCFWGRPKLGSMSKTEDRRCREKARVESEKTTPERIIITRSRSGEVKAHQESFSQSLEIDGEKLCDGRPLTKVFARCL